MIKTLILIFLSLLQISALWGGSADGNAQFKIQGTVVDAQNNEPLTGVAIKVKGVEKYAISGLDGSFVISGLELNNYQLEISFLGYKTLDTQWNVSNTNPINIRLYPQSIIINGAIVKGKRDITSDESARVDERRADNVINILSARSIELSPDLTVANVTQRVSGVSLERNANGDGQHAIVRGMDKRYNYTLVNGIKIPSPDQKNRYVPLDIFPSDLLDRLVVTKSLLPNMEGDAIGGVIDMKMKDAPNKFTLNFSTGLGYNLLFNQRAFRGFDRGDVSILSPHQVNSQGYLATVGDFPRSNMVMEDQSNKPINRLFSLSLGNRFFKNKLGLIVAGSMQQTYRGANSMFMTTFVNQDNNTPYYEIMQIRQFSVEQVRGGLHTKLDYKINARNKIDLYAAYVDLQESENRSRIDTILKIGRGQGPGTGRVELRERSRQRIQKIYNTTLQGNHQISIPFKIDWSLVYSLATNNDPDMVELKWLTGVTLNSQTGEYQYEPLIYDRDFTRRWTSNTDKDLAAYFNLYYKMKLKNRGEIDWSAGGMYRDKNRTNYFTTYLFRTSPINQTWSGSINDYTFNLFNNIGTPTDPLNYRSAERVAAAYGMGTYTQKKLKIIGGVRIEDTYFEWETNAPPQIAGRVGSITYLDVLPSVHLKYELKKKMNLRSSYFSSISRPNFFEVVPYDINEEDFRERGNPDLNRTRAANFDMRWEYFPKPLDQIMVGLFYKRIVDPIESALRIVGQSVFLQPNNFGIATNAGIEMDYTKYVSKFGVRAFYTFTHSEITTTKIVRFRDINGNLSSREEDQTRPLQGQSMHIANLALLYKNAAKKLDLQLAMVYTGDRIISVSPYLDNDIWQRGFVQLDFSAEKKFKNGVGVFVKMNNLLNTPLLADIRLPNTFNPGQVPSIDSSIKTPVRQDFYWQSFVLGLKYKI
jgi:hypothetical protein